MHIKYKITFCFCFFTFCSNPAIKDIAVVSIDVNITIPYSILNFGKCFIITYDTGISSIFIFISIFNIEINIEIANVKTIVDIIMLICDISFCFIILFKLINTGINKMLL